MTSENTLYTIVIYSENIAGLLSQITAVFTRRQINIESLTVCASSTPGIHKYTITCCCTEETVIMLTKQIEKKVDVLQANYYTDDEIFILETSLLKISTPIVLANNDISKIIRQHTASIVEVNSTYSSVEKTGTTQDILSLYQQLAAYPGLVLQFVRSGRICITKSHEEKLDQYLLYRQRQNRK